MKKLVAFLRSQLWAILAAIFCFVATAHATGWTIRSPTTGTNFALGASVSASGSSNGMVIGVPYTLYVCDNSNSPPTVMNSNTGTSQATTGNWSCTVAPPQVLMGMVLVNQWTKTANGLVKITGADGQSNQVAVTFGQ